MSGTDDLRKKLIKACYWYYVKCDPIMKDQEYDMQLKILQKIEDKVGTVDWSPTQIIYGDREENYPEGLLEWIRQR